MRIRIVETIIDFGKERFKHKMKDAEASVVSAFSTQDDVEIQVANKMKRLADRIKHFRYKGAYPMVFGIYTTPPIVTISFTAPSAYSNANYSSLDAEEQAAVDFIVNNRITLLQQLDFVESEMDKIHTLAETCPAGSKYAFDKTDGEDRHNIPNVAETRKIIHNAVKIYKNK